MTYNRSLVELLLPSVWDEGYAYGMRMPTVPDPDMPKATPDKKKGTALYAHLADIRHAWRTVRLPHNERCALFLYYGCDWKQKEIGYNQGVSQREASGRISDGVGKIVNHLNGTNVMTEKEIDD